MHLYLHNFEQAMPVFEDGSPEKARAWEIQGRWQDAAEGYKAAGLAVHAAVCLEKAKEFTASTQAWQGLSRHPSLRGNEYETALVSFNLGMAALHAGVDANLARKSLVESQRKLEQVADLFETRGERERAFDCYHILLKLGKDSGQFENLAEGYLNCIRVLKTDNLKFYVLQYYEDFIELALEQDELHAAASLFQEAADYASRSSLPYDQYYLARAASTWAQCGEKYHRENAPVDMVENALTASISSYSSVGNYPKVKELFQRLSELDLPKKKRERFLRIASEYEGQAEKKRVGPEFPEHLKHQAYADIWFMDLVEWELGGDPYSVALSIIGDLRYPNGIRRRALVIALVLENESESERKVATLCQVAELLGELQSYAALRPLEHLFDNGPAEVRRASIRALRFLFFKRSFFLLHRALEDSDQGVRDAALVALRGLHFPHAFNPLARIFHESTEQRVRLAALESIGRIQSIEAGEFLLMAIRQEPGEIQSAARQALSSFDNPDVIPIVRQHFDIESDQSIKETLGGLLKSFS